MSSSGDDIAARPSARPETPLSAGQVREKILAGDVQPGDLLETDDGAPVRVAAIREAKWIKDANHKPLLEFFERRNDRSGFLIGRSDEVFRVRPKGQGRTPDQSGDPPQVDEDGPGREG